MRDIQVTSAQALSAAQRTLVEQTLLKKFGKDRAVTFTVDESLTSGIQVQVGSELLDFSLGNRLKNGPVKRCGFFRRPWRFD
jgi:F-type H+-transporting ATPase subunit delta